MQTTLRIDDGVYREAKAEAARCGMTLTCFIENALRQFIAKGSAESPEESAEVVERDRLMEALLRRTAHFRIGEKPSRGEMNDRGNLSGY